MFGVRDVMLYLGQFGITPAEALRVWKLWGAAAVDKVKANPYLLCLEGLNIGFERADHIAMELNFPAEDEHRVRAGILYVVRHNMSNGHTCLPEKKVLEISAQMLGISHETATSVMAALKLEKSLIPEQMEGTDFVFTPAYHHHEVYAAGRLKMMLCFPPMPFHGIEEDIDAVEQEKGIHYETMQRQAIVQALSRGILVLTGGPGTGKTTTLNAMIRLLEWKGQKVALAAPTGRAAKRMSEVTGKEAKTIHRLLEVEWNEEDHPVFARNEKNLLECDALIVDELSMVDAALFASLLSALPLGCRLVMVGDSDQLPSVGAGNVLHDIIDSGILPVVRLQEIFRQSMQSRIISNAHRIVCGEMPELADRSNDFFFLKEANSSTIASTIVDLCAHRLPKSYGYSPMNDIQVLCPGRKGDLGVVELNKQLQQELNPPARGKREITIRGTLLREQDKVMQIKNDYDITWTKEDGSTGTGVYNGDVGILEIADRAAGAIVVKYEDREAVYTVESAENLSLAYAMTVHKSQGNEFDAVIMPMYPGPPQLYFRNLLYTAVTRAKRLLILVGYPSVVKTMVDNNKKTRRYSGLKHFLTGDEETFSENDEGQM